MMKATILLFGATGDLSKKKIIPSLYHLLLDKKINDFAVIGNGRRQITVKEILDASKPYIKKVFKKEVWKDLEQRFYYVQSDVENPEMFVKLRKVVHEVEQKHHLPGNRLFYLATLPDHFDGIIHNIKKAGLADDKGGWSRVAIEKPFGRDLKSAKKLNQCVHKAFKEDQIHRIDHYLGKELVQNIVITRFTNTFFEPLWNKEHIDHVQIILSEDIGIEGRGEFYDTQGILKDVVQNHLLQLLCLTAMEAPKLLTGEPIREEKVKVLKAIKKIDQKNVVLGQYVGYHDEKGVKKNSQTETFALIKLFVESSKWKGVPFYLVTGKSLKQRTSSIVIQFKEPVCRMFGGICNYGPNTLIIQIQPNEGFYMKLNAKVPGSTNIVAVDMEFCHECTFGPQTPEAYENVLLEIAQGNQQIFIRNDEIEQAWRLIDGVTKKKIKVYQYHKGTIPKEAAEFMKKDHRALILDIPHAKIHR